MKIVFVTTEFVTEPNHFDGGLANYLYKIAGALVRDGHTVVVVVRSHEDARFLFEGIQIDRVKVDLAPRRFQWLRAIVRLPRPINWLLTGLLLRQRLQALCRKERFDVVQYSSFMATGLFRVTRLPTVIRISSYHKHISEAMGLQPGSREDRLLRFLERAALHRADRIFGPARYVARLIQSELKCEVSVIETLFVPPTETTLDLDPMAGQKYLLYVGKLARLKGATLVAEIIGTLLKSHPDLHFAFAGRTSPLEKKIRAAAGSNADRLHFLGRVTHSDLWPLLRRAEGVVLPSFNDNFPNTCVEAMSCQKIVVGTRGASFEQLIEDGENGYLIEKGDSSSLLEKLNTLLGLDLEARTRLESKAFQTIQRLHPSLIVPQTVELYEKTIQEFRRKKGWSR